MIWQIIIAVALKWAAENQEGWRDRERMSRNCVQQKTTDDDDEEKEEDLTQEKHTT